MACTLAVSGCVEVSGDSWPRYVERDEKRFAVTGRPDLSVSTFDGSVEIRAWDRPEVLVAIEKRAGDKEEAATIEVHAEQNGDRVVVEVKARHLARPWHGGALGQPHRVGSRRVRRAGQQRRRVLVDLPNHRHAGSAVGRWQHPRERPRRRSARAHWRWVDRSGRRHRGSGHRHRRRQHSRRGQADQRAGTQRRRPDRDSSRAGQYDRAEIGTSIPATARSRSICPTRLPASSTRIPATAGSQLRNLTLSGVSGEFDRHNLRGRLGSGGKRLRVRTETGRSRSGNFRFSEDLQI